MDNFKKQTGIDFNDFYTNNKAFVLNYIKRLHTKSNLDLEGIVDISFAKVYQNIDKYDNTKSSIRTYVCKAALFEVMYQRKLKINKHIYQEISETQSLDYYGHTYEQEQEEYDYSIDERFEALKNDINEFYTIHKNIGVVDCWLNGMTYAEMVVELDISIEKCKNTMHEFKKWIRNKYGIETTKHINKGKIEWHEEPIRCIDCGKILKWKKATRCNDCENIKRRRKDKPDLNTLELEVMVLGYCATGRKYGVSDNCIRKWIKKYKKWNE